MVINPTILSVVRLIMLDTVMTTSKSRNPNGTHGQPGTHIDFPSLSRITINPVTVAAALIPRVNPM